MYNVEKEKDNGMSNICLQVVGGLLDVIVPFPSASFLYVDFYFKTIAARCNRRLETFRLLRHETTFLLYRFATASRTPFGGFFARACLFFCSRGSGSVFLSETCLLVLGLGTFLLERGTIYVVTR